MICTKCGKEVGEGAAFCASCGARVIASKDSANDMAEGISKTGSKKKGKKGLVVTIMLLIGVVIAAVP